MPAFLAQIDQAGAAEFRPAEQLNDLARAAAGLREAAHRPRVPPAGGPRARPEEPASTRSSTSPSSCWPRTTASSSSSTRSGELVAARRCSTARAGDDEVVVSDTVLKRVTETRQAVLTADAILDARFSVVGEHRRAGHPLRHGGAAAGQGRAQGRAVPGHAASGPTPSREKDLKILSGIASQAAIALENAELARKIEPRRSPAPSSSRFLSPGGGGHGGEGPGRAAARRAGWRRSACSSRTSAASPPWRRTRARRRRSRMLNAFFTAMADVVFRHEGNLDKFIGDCVMAVWGPPSPHPDDAARALQRGAGDAGRGRRAQRASAWPPGKQPIEVGIGVNTGQAVVGYMGSRGAPRVHRHRRLGEHRLAAVRPGQGRRGARHRDHRAAGPGTGFDAEALPVSQVKGKEKGVPTYRVVGRRDDRRPQARDDPAQTCPNCQRAHDVGVYVTGQQRALQLRHPLRGAAHDVSVAPRSAADDAAAVARSAAPRRGAAPQVSRGRRRPDASPAASAALRDRTAPATFIAAARRSSCPATSCCELLGQGRHGRGVAGASRSRWGAWWR